jgi:IS30 family transposase
MTKRRNAGKNQEAKHLNETAHQRAMKNPKTQAVFRALQERWDGMSAAQQGEQLIESISLKCSVRGIADELGKPESTIRRYIRLSKSTETSSGWNARMERTLAKGPLTQKTKSAREVAGCEPSEIPAKKGARPVIQEMSPVKDDVHLSTTQQTKRITSSSSTSAQVRPVMNQTLSEKESRPGEHEPKTNLVDLYMSRGLAKIQRLAAIADSIQPRPFRDARSMQRQGRPLPPIDPKGTVS